MPTEPATARPRPCASCPYRRDVPSGVWSAEEYAKLPGFDGPTGEQTPRIFYCHADTGHLCSGWLGHADPYELLGLRIAVSTGRADPEALGYRTDVPLFGSGAEAAAHGLAEVEAPAPEAAEVIAKIRRTRTARGEQR